MRPSEAEVAHLNALKGSIMIEHLSSYSCLFSKVLWRTLPANEGYWQMHRSKENNTVCRVDCHSVVYRAMQAGFTP